MTPSVYAAPSISNAFPDLHITLDDVIAEGSKVVAVPVYSHLNEVIDRW
jgi:hypothetical protein